MLKVRYNSYLIPKGFIGITLWPFGIFIKLSKAEFINKYGEEHHNRTIRHERIHENQQKGLLGVMFYLFYFLNWIINLFIDRNAAYRNIVFEKEAYEKEDDLTYYKLRLKYAWTKYI